MNPSSPDGRTAVGLGVGPAERRNHGPFYRSDELVGLIHQNVGMFGGLHPGYRAVHAYGRFYVGTFTATDAASKLSRAAHFRGDPVPVSVRFSPSSGDPTASAGAVMAMATRFYLHDGTVTDLIGITLPAFPARTADEVAELLTAGKEGPERLGEFAAAHPALVRIKHMVETSPVPVSLPRTSFRALHTYRFVNSAGESTWARYHWEPEAGTDGMPIEKLASVPRTYLFDDLDHILRGGPAVWRLELELAESGDPLDDVSEIWPEGRTRVVVGRLELTRPIEPGELGDPVMMHDPTQVTDGIEVHPDDEIISARRGAYLASAAERTGGWQDRAPALCPFSGTRTEP